MSRAVADTSVLVAQEAGRPLERLPEEIAATALRHGAAVVTQDDDFSAFFSIDVLRV